MRQRPRGKEWACKGERDKANVRKSECEGARNIGQEKGCGRTKARTSVKEQVCATTCVRKS